MKTTSKLNNPFFVLIAFSTLLAIIMVGLFSFNTGKDYPKNPLPETVKIIMYGKKGCVYCTMAKKLLEERALAYESINIDTNIDLQKKLIDRTQQLTVPYIFINGNFIGGYSDLLKQQF